MIQVRCLNCNGIITDSQCGCGKWMVTTPTVSIIATGQSSVDTGNAADGGVATAHEQALRIGSETEAEVRRERAKEAQRLLTCPACEAAAQERDDLHSLCDRQADILGRVAVALRGPEPPLTRWSHHDLPERAERAVRERDAAYEDARQMQARLQRLIDADPQRELADLRARLEALADEWAAKAEEAIRLSRMAALGDEEYAMLDISIELLNSHAAELRALLRKEAK